MQTSRIPAYDRSNLNGRLMWFAEMSKRGLLLHPEEAPEDIIEIASARRYFPMPSARKSAASCAACSPNMVTT